VWPVGFVDGLHLSEIDPVDSGRWTQMGLFWMTTSVLLPPRWKTLAIVKQFGFIEKPSPTPGTGTCSYEPRTTLSNGRK